MTGSCDDWTSICLKKHVVRDYQLILKWVANVRYWPDCDPGKVDGDHGLATSKALRAFKKRFNGTFGGTLTESGTVDKPTWDAFFKMYMQGLAGLLQVEEEAVIELAEKRELPGRKIGEEWRFSREAVLAWLAEEE